MASAALLHRRPSRTICDVRAHGSRSAVLGALLALLAMLTMAAVSGWDGATFHADDPLHAASVQHDRIEGARQDPDGAVHLAAHAAGHGLALPGAVAAPMPPLPRRMAWTPGVSLIGPGLTGRSLLRPPRG